MTLDDKTRALARLREDGERAAHEWHHRCRVCHSDQVIQVGVLRFLCRRCQDYYSCELH